MHPKFQMPDGSYWVYGYDSLGQVTNAVKHWADKTLVAGQQFDYAFDTIGNRTQTQSGGDTNGTNLRVANYTNNSLNQITSRDVPPYVDILGASILTNAVTVNGTTAYRKEEYFRQQLGVNNTNSALWTNIIVAGGINVTGNVYVAKKPEVFLYDADGNLTNDGRWAYTWDGENRLIGLTVNTNVGPLYLLTFAYDYQGRRIQKLVVSNSVAIYTNRFLYDGWNLVAEVDPSGSQIRTYVWGSDLSGSLQGAGGVGGLLEVSYYSGSTTNNCFPAFDGNGNVMALINAADGTVVANYEYAAFGEPIRITGVMARNNPFRFSTKYDDDESDLLYYGYRYYKPSTGTWPNRDPIMEQGGLNLHSYVNNNPVSAYDSDGRITVTTLTMNPDTSCGDSFVDFKFVLDKPATEDGYIVQMIKYTEDYEKRFSNPMVPSEKNHFEKTYWEAWLVKSNDIVPTLHVGEITDHSETRDHPSSEGTTLSAGQIKFFYKKRTGNLGDPGAKPIVPPTSNGWHQGNRVDWSVDLPYMDPPGPKWWNDSPDNGEASAVRSVLVEWNCTCKGIVLTHKVTTTPKK